MKDIIITDPEEKERLLKRMSLKASMFEPFIVIIAILLAMVLMMSKYIDIEKTRHLEIERELISQVDSLTIELDCIKNPDKVYRMNK